jgi:hypothetical protein
MVTLDLTQALFRRLDVVITTPPAEGSTCQGSFTLDSPGSLEVEFHHLERSS